jgi:hypothetical protein
MRIVRAMMQAGPTTNPRASQSQRCAPAVRGSTIAETLQPLRLGDTVTLSLPFASLPSSGVVK